MEQKSVSLLELNRKIKSVIKENCQTWWLTAEISEISVNYSGHCYLEFIQKDEASGKVLARSRATIWANVFRMIKPYFETTTGRPLSEGISVMVRITVEFHELYGLSLNVVDIEPTYTVGEMALRKQKIIKKLQDEGVFEMNRELELPILLKRIAVVSSETAAGYEDFIDQLHNNPHGFSFYTKLFPAVMQGNEAEASIIRRLEQIFEIAHYFDAVVIIRGGGAQADLDCFNSYWLAYHITQLPLPVFTGIGHEQDDSVVDMVAHTRLKTPTAVAEFLIDHLAEVENELHYTTQQIAELSFEKIYAAKDAVFKSAYFLQNNLTKRISLENKNLDKLNHQIRNESRINIYRNHNELLRLRGVLRFGSNFLLFALKNKLGLLQNSMVSLVNANFQNQKHRLEIGDQFVRLNNPDEVLAKGYSITLKNGKVIKEISNLNSGDEIETRYHSGKSKSIITETHGN